MKLLVLSNGHGEDEIAIRIIERLQQQTPGLELSALPIVGRGYAYKNLQIPLAGRVQQMPSGGFIYQGGNPLWQDLRGGLISLTIEQLKTVREWEQQGVILAVGDIVPLLYAWLSRANYAFVGTAKSDYYLRDEAGWLERTSWVERKLGSVYLPWERWLMSRDRCQAVFPRDSLTAKSLQEYSIPAYDLGNPMMDGIEAQKQSKSGLNILLLPGSRMPEALSNWHKILVAVASTSKTLSESKINYYSAIAPALDIKPFVAAAVDRGWHTVREESRTVTLIQNGRTLRLSQISYQQFLTQADLAIAMAGTATEQFVGLGKPAVIFPGEGPQFTYAFAEAQSRLLGCSVLMVSSPEVAGEAIANILNNSEFLQKISLNGQRRMGRAGAAERIACCLQKTLLSSRNCGQLAETNN